MVLSKCSKQFNKKIYVTKKNEKFKHVKRSNEPINTPKSLNKKILNNFFNINLELVTFISILVYNLNLKKVEKSNCIKKKREGTLF